MSSEDVVEGCDLPPTKSRTNFEEADVPSTSTIAFVNTSGPITKDAKVQSQIRRHVMRDIGKARRKDSKKVAVAERPSPASKLTMVASASPELYHSIQFVKAEILGVTSSSGEYAAVSLPEGSDRTQFDYSPSISRFSAGRIDPFLKYPIQMTPRVSRLVDHVFNDGNRNIKFYRDIIFPVGMLGPAAFHQVLSNLLHYLRLARPLEAAEEYEAREELAHQAMVFKLVNQKIAKKDGIDVDVLSAIAALACNAHVGDDYSGYRLHMRGLKEALKIRGGVETLDGNPILRTSFYWLEVNGGSTEDLVPEWPIPIMYTRMHLPMSVVMPPGAAYISTTWRSLLAQSELMDIFDDTARFSVHLEEEERRNSFNIYSDVVYTGNFIIGLIHRLLSAQNPVANGSDPNPQSGNENTATRIRLRETCRLALLLFLAPIRRTMGLHPINTRVHVRKLKQAFQLPIQTQHADRDVNIWTDLFPLRLWILTMGVLEAVSGTGSGSELEESDWFVGEWIGEWARVSMAGGAAQGEGMRSAGMAAIAPVKVDEVLKSLMWVDSCHGERFSQPSLKERLFGRGRILAPRPLQESGFVV